MQYILDNLAASVVFGMVALMLVTVQLRSQESVRETSKLYTLRAKQMVFIDFLRSDLNGVTQVDAVEEDSVSLSFSFESRIASDTTARQVTYKRVQTGVNGEVPVYEVVRYVDGAKSGKSMDGITDWEIVARNAEGGSIVKTGNARQIYVRFDVLSPLADTDVLPTRQWEATFRPISLRQNNKL